jgi:hypothetical protein
MAASTCDDSFISSWCSSSAHYGQGNTIHLCEIWTILCNGLGISHSFTTAYQPQSNGMIEHALCTHYCERNNYELGWMGWTGQNILPRYFWGSGLLQKNIVISLRKTCPLLTSSPFLTRSFRPQNLFLRSSWSSIVSLHLSQHAGPSLAPCGELKTPSTELLDDRLPEPTRNPEVEVIKLNSAKNYRFLQLLSHSRGFFARV